MTIDGASTNTCPAGTVETLSKRGIGAGGEPCVNLTYPPYAIHNGEFPRPSFPHATDRYVRSTGAGALSTNTLAANATHYGGYVDLDVHNMFGMMEEKATYLALQTIFDGKRPFLISRSTFPSAGRWTGHWVRLLVFLVGKGKCHASSYRRSSWETTTANGSTST